MTISSRLQPPRAAELVELAYESAVSPACWPKLLAEISAATGSEGALVWLHDFRDSSADRSTAALSFACEVGIEPNAMQRYAEHFTFINPWLPLIRELGEDRVAVSSEIYPDALLQRTEFYADWLAPQRLGYALGGPIVRREQTIAMLSLLRPLRHGPYLRSEKHVLELLMPHLRRACLLRQRLAQPLAERSGAVAALDRFSVPVWLLDREGRVLLANAAGRQFLSRCDGLAVGRDGRPTTRDLEDRRALNAAIAEALAPASRHQVERSNAALIRHRASQPLLVTAYPAGRESFDMGCGALLFIDEPLGAASPANPQALEALYGLTPVEGRLVAALCNGLSLSDYCARQGCSPNTAKTHLKRIFAKTETHRQASLVRLAAPLLERSAGIRTVRTNVPDGHATAPPASPSAASRPPAPSPGTPR